MERDSKGGLYVDFRLTAREAALLFHAATREADIRHEQGWYTHCHRLHSLSIRLRTVLEDDAPTAIRDTKL